MVAIGSRIAIVEVEPVFPAQATTRDDCPFGVGQIPSLMELRRAIQVPGDSGSHQPKLVTVVSTGATVVQAILEIAQPAQQAHGISAPRQIPFQTAVTKS